MIKYHVRVSVYLFCQSFGIQSNNGVRCTFCGSRHILSTNHEKSISVCHVFSLFEINDENLFRNDRESLMAWRTMYTLKENAYDHSGQFLIVYSVWDFKILESPGFLHILLKKWEITTNMLKALTNHTGIRTISDCLLHDVHAQLICRSSGIEMPEFAIHDNILILLPFLCITAKKLELKENIWWRKRRKMVKKHQHFISGTLVCIKWYGQNQIWYRRIAGKTISLTSTAVYYPLLTKGSCKTSPIVYYYFGI